MRRATLTMALLLAAGAAGADEKPKTAGAEDQRALLKLEEDFAAAWNKGDYKAMAALWDDDGDLINPVGRVARGRAEIEKLFLADQTGPFKATHFTITCPATGIRMVKSDVAVVDCSWEVTGAKDAVSQARPPMTGLSSGVAMKSGGRWRWVAGRAMVPIPPMGPPPKP
jgi:uncharacterized protein (TIGR02246 family)